jgi:hypothetical protein
MARRHFRRQLQRHLAGDARLIASKETARRATGRSRFGN